MVLIPAGSFARGCNAALDPSCLDDEKPQKLVTLASFWLDRFETTTAEYKACLGANSCSAPNGGSGFCNKSDSAAANCFSWVQAEAYCKWKGKRLPTEAEWEKAARGGCEKAPGDCATQTQLYPWGNNAPKCDLTTMNGCGFSSPTAVTGDPSDLSPYGVRNLGGNVQEWISDGYSKAYYATAPATDPTGPANAGLNRVVRGGSVNSNVASLFRASRRGFRNRTKNSFDIGFRCAKSTSAK